MNLARNFKHRLKVISFLVMAVGFVIASKGNAQTVVLDWDSQSWPPTTPVPSGSVSREFETDSANSGNDIRITISGNTPNLINQTPKTSTSVNGGTGQTALWIAVDYPAGSFDSAVTVTIEFLYAQGVEDVIFKIFDIDADDNGGSHYKDRIRDIYGNFNNAGTVYPDLTGSANNTVKNSGKSNATITGDTSTSDTSSAANGTLDYKGTTVDEAGFTYGTRDVKDPDAPTTQWIAIGDITYKKKVPEVGTSVVAILLCGGLIFFRPLARKWARRNASS